MKAGPIARWQDNLVAVNTTVCVCGCVQDCLEAGSENVEGGGVEAASVTEELLGTMLRSAKGAECNESPFVPLERFQYSGNYTQI